MMFLHELTSFTVTHLVNIHEYTVLPEVAELANKIRESLSVDAQDLPAFCIAKRQHGFLRNEQQHPRPTLHYAERVLETIAHDIQQSAVLDILFAQAFIRDHMDLFAPAEADDPRRQLEDEIADLEAQRGSVII
jgi:hypothetical protein